jgi:hypothetical protein
MPYSRRAHAPGGTYFFNANTYRRQTFLTDLNVRSALREAVGTLRSTHPFVSWRGRAPYAGLSASSESGLNLLNIGAITMGAITMRKAAMGPVNAPVQSHQRLGDRRMAR